MCAVTLGGIRYLVLPFDPISLVLAQRNGVEPPKKSAFLPRWLHHPRERSCLGYLYSSSPDFGRGRCGFLARSAFESFARLFKGGGVQGRSPCPRSAERGILFMLILAQEGFPLLFVLWVCTCAPILWEVVATPSCHSTPFLWCLPKETVSSRQRKALFYPGGSTIRVSAFASVVGGHLRPTWGRGWCVFGPPAFAGGERDWLWPLCAVSLLRGRHCRYQVPPTAKSAFLWGSTPFLCARAKKWGGTGSRGKRLLPKKTAHTYRVKTRSFPPLPVN